MSRTRIDGRPFLPPGGVLRPETLAGGVLKRGGRFAYLVSLTYTFFVINDHLFGTLVPSAIEATSELKRS